VTVALVPTLMKQFVPYSRGSKMRVHGYTLYVAPDNTWVERDEREKETEKEKRRVRIERNKKIKFEPHMQQEELYA